MFALCPCLSSSQQALGLLCFNSMDPSTENASSRSMHSRATSSVQCNCFCEWPMMVKTAHNEENFGSRFVQCENWKASTLFDIFLSLHFCGEYEIVLVCLCSILM